MDRGAAARYLPIVASLRLSLVVVTAAAPGLDLMMGMQFDKSPAPARTVTLDQPSFSHEIPTITDSITLPPSNVRGHGSNNIMTFSVEATL